MRNKNSRKETPNRNKQTSNQANKQTNTRARLSPRLGAMMHEQQASKKGRRQGRQEETYKMKKRFGCCVLGKEPKQTTIKQTNKPNQPRGVCVCVCSPKTYAPSLRESHEKQTYKPTSKQASKQANKQSGGLSLLPRAKHAHNDQTHKQTNTQGSKQANKNKYETHAKHRLAQTLRAKLRFMPLISYDRVIVIAVYFPI